MNKHVRMSWHAVWRRLMTVLAVLGTIFAVVVACNTVSAHSAWAEGTEQASGTLYPYIESAKLLQRSNDNENWKEVGPNDKLDPNNANLQLQFNLGFDLPKDTLSSDNSTLTYQVPNGIQLSGFKDGEDTISGDIMDNGESMGTYVIHKNGLIELKFNDKTVQRNQTMDISNGYLKFESTVGGIGNGDDVTWKFGDDSELTVKFNKTGDLWAYKNAVSPNNDDGTVQWQIVVGSNKGTNPEDTVHITDTMTDNAYVADTFKVVDADGNDVTASCGKTPEAGSTRFAIDCPALKAGEKYTITYTGKAQNLTDGYTVGKNKADVTTTDKDGNKLEQHPSSEVKWDRTPSVSKKGELQPDGKVKWTVSITSKGELDGWTLKDVVTPEDLDIADVTLTDDATGASQSITLPYVFSEGSGKSYTVTYYTDAPKGSLVVKNQAVLSPPNTDNGKTDEKSNESSVSYNPVTKTGNSSTGIKDESNRTVNNWTVTIAPPEGMSEIPANWKYTDTFSNQWNFNQYMTAEQQKALEEAVKEKLPDAKISFTTSTVSGKTADSEGAVPDGEYVTGFTITSDRKLTKSISFTYDTTGVVKGQWNQSYTNSGKINNLPERNATLNYTPATPTESDWTISKTDALDDTQGNTEHAYHELQCQTGHEKPTGVGEETTCDAPYMEWNVKLQQNNYQSTDDYTSDLRVTETLPANTALLDGQTANGAGLVLQMKNLYGSNIGTFVLSVPADGQTTTTTYHWNPNFWDSSQNKNITDVPLNFTVTRNDNQLVITLPKEVLKALNTYVWNKGNLSFVLTVRAGFKGLDLSKSWKEAKTFKNTANLNDGSDSNGTTVSQAQTITKNDDWNAVRKSHGTVGDDNVIPYSVVVNPYGKDLDSRSDTITLTDVMTYTHNSGNNLSISLKNVKVYAFDANKKNADGSACENAQCRGDEIPAEKYSYTYTHTGDTERTNTLTFTLPDSTPLIVAYDYQCTGTLGDHGNVVKNTASMEGVSSSSDKTTVIVKESSAGAATNVLQFHKVDSRNYAVGLSGVTFALYQWNSSALNGKGDYVRVSSDANLTTNQDGIIYLSAGKNSCVEDQSCSGSTVTVRYNTAYKLVEVSPKDGYEGTDKAYYFTVPNTDTDKWPIAQPKDFQGAQISGSYDDYFTNTRKQAVLPSTGGLGDGWYVAGGLLTVTVAVLGLAETLRHRRGSRTC